jgi:hypothetical protein
MAQNPLNTGPNGFGIDGKTYDFDVGLPEGEGGPQGTRARTVDVSAGYLDSNGKPKDLTRKTQTTLANYLSQQTLGKGDATGIPNDYPVDPGYDQVSIRTKTGRPALQSPGIPDPKNSRVFAPDEGSFSSLSKDYPSISKDFGKGQSDSRKVDGNDLLPGIAGDSPRPGVTPKPIKGHKSTAGVLTPYVSSVLSSNRFSAAAASFVGTSDIAGAEANADGVLGFDPGLTNQTQFGIYDPKAPSIALGRMAAIGPLLTMRAGTELGSSDPGADPNASSLQAGALLPGVAQLGVERISPQVLTAEDVLATLTTDEPTGDTFVLSTNGLSWGQLNNVDDPYDGTDALGMVALSTALVAGVEVIFDGLSILLGLITPQLKQPARDPQGRYSLGEYFPGTKAANQQNSGGIGGALSALTSLNFGALLGIQPTNYPFSRALVAGMNAFFQIPDSSGGGIGLNQLVGAFTSSTDSPGFNVVVARSIARSSLTIVDQLKKIGGNPMSVINQILSLIDTIRTSKIIAACNIFATLGDAVLSLPPTYVDTSSNKTRTSSMDSKDDTINNAVSKNRLKGTLKLAWSNNRAPANILLPGSILALSLSVKNLGQFSSDVGLRRDPFSLVQTAVVAATDMGRISSEAAYAFEDQLEASYVPFYFHDVRTNEMVSFHAFLATLTDDYTAQYDKTEGIGRVEPVKIYKGTERRIGISFYIVATSPADFDEMYIKINRLVTMLYPQYTSGVQMSDSSGQAYAFTQPFSQLQGASPLIRLRLGDLIRSNYSLFALGRLFGMGNPNFTINSQKFTDADKVDQAAVDAYSAAIQDLLTNPDGSKTFYPDYNRSYDYVDPSSTGGGIGISIPSPLGGSSDGPPFGPSFTPSDSEYKGAFVIKVQQLDPTNPFMVIGQVQPNSDPLYVANTSGIQDYVDKNFNSSDFPLKKFVGGTYRFPIQALHPTEQTLADTASGVSALASLTPDSAFGSEVANFLNPQNNAIAKSFQDTGGRGLAGFIETMNFDWHDKVTWEIGLGRTAPKMCKVTLTFSPVHDISPGIDHLGFNRGPIYPVGAMAQGPMPYQTTQ